MKRRLVPAMPAMHLPRQLHVSPRWRVLESPLRIAQFVFLIWLGVVGGRLLARGLIQAFETVSRMLA